MNNQVSASARLRGLRTFSSLAVMAVAILSATPASAAKNAPPKEDNASIQKTLEDLAKKVASQQERLSKLEADVQSKDRKIVALETQLEKKQKPQTTSGESPAPVKNKAALRSRKDDSMPVKQVGQAPTGQDKPPEVALLASSGGVLTPYGSIVLEPFADYGRSSINNFTFLGGSLLPSFLIGEISANRVARDIVTTGATLRAGVTNRLELETKVPFVWRQDTQVNTVVSLTGSPTVHQTTNGYGMGDVEFAAHYQINNGQQDWPFFIANIRYKSDTGSSPYRVAYNPDGSSKDLATGSGFMSVSPSVTAIYPLDPAVLFGNIGYVHSFGETINRTVAGSAIGTVDPGDAYTASVGMGVALNDRLSFTLGYEHGYVRPTITEIAGFSQRGDSLQVGTALTGFSFKVNNRVHVNLNVATGVTRDAPDAQVTLRVPVSLQAFGQ